MKEYKVVYKNINKEIQVFYTKAKDTAHALHLWRKLFNLTVFYELVKVEEVK